jgi:membrane-anchored protein YejM (alkaline phosphatase superfamily)
MSQHQQEPVLMRQLMEDDYQLGIFASASLAIPDFASVIFNQVPHLEVTVPGHNSHERDQAVTERLKTFLQHRELNRPVFSFLFYDAVHAYCEPSNQNGPFQPALRQCNRFALKHGRDQIQNRYLNAVNFVDQQVDAILKTIKEAQLWDNSIIMITADHGEEFDDNQLRYWGHTSNFTKYQTQVPLLIHWPKKQHQIYQYPTTHYDIVPTLMRDALYCQAPYTHYAEGVNLFDSRPRYPIIISNNDGVAYVTADQITILPPSGGVIIQDSHANMLVDRKPEKREFSRVLQQLNQFMPITGD